jgi:hypothetical protein
MMRSVISADRVFAEVVRVMVEPSVASAHRYAM